MDINKLGKKLENRKGKRKEKKNQNPTRPMSTWLEGSDHLAMAAANVVDLDVRNQRGREREMGHLRQSSLPKDRDCDEVVAIRLKV